MTGKFTNRFQHSLANEIEKLFQKWPKANDLTVNVDINPGSEWRGRPDIWIGRKNRLNKYDRILSIEIEHKSHQTQAMDNLQQALEWVRNNQRRKATVIHLINEKSKISEDKCIDILQQGYINRFNRFTYDFRQYIVNDGRGSSILAQELTAKEDFQNLLWQHMLFLEII
ncbi:MAG: hypothetical protein H6Q66_1993 [Firmicutes bacterium]|nr:hypothetical protein [Bacillota bacterium]